MAHTLYLIAKTARPRQWIKNLAIFAPLIFSGKLLIIPSLIIVIQAFAIFCGLTSAMYFINDVLDAPRDRLHPFKKKRPIASRDLSVPVALAVAFALILTLLPLSYNLSVGFFVIVFTYLLLQLAYSFIVKHVILLDVMSIAAGFILRIYAGIWVVGAHMNIWFLLCVVSISLFLAVGKRRSELTLLAGELAGAHRATLSHYPEILLHSLTTMFATATWISYAMFAFLQPPVASKLIYGAFFDEIIPPPPERKWLMLTIPLVIYGVMRYLYLIYEKKEGESPERVLLSDKPLLATVIIWLLLTVGIIYILGA
ncbi:UbiA prenyltransferase family protein [Candidatus Daviesbacteria bacterium]|nr:UbiA prenyltransferase family protein [Candidatus Daviesbacteria bacterium]